MFSPVLEAARAVAKSAAGLKRTQIRAAMGNSIYVYGGNELPDADREQLVLSWYSSLEQTKQTGPRAAFCILTTRCR